ncbi:MAG: S6e family ribosomal protein [Thermoprotei archaeon]|nr:S6e family ribosomal protein [TACK group archaeon]
MPEFKLNVSDESGKTKSVKAEGALANNLIGLRVGDEIPGDALDFKGATLKITGGSDKSGFPMLAWLPGGGKKEIYVKKGSTREKKWFRGSVITEDIVQINMKVVSQRSNSEEQQEQKAEAR